MSKQRTAHRWRLGVIILIACIFALGSFWLLQVMHNGATDAQVDAHSSEPDYIVENFSVVRMTKLGQPRYILSGDKLTHRPSDDSSEVERPIMQSLSAEQPPLTIRALHAHIEHGNTRVELFGHVTIERAASPQAQSLLVKTEALTVLPDDDQMQTDLPVEMMLGKATVNGTGMMANNATRQIDIKSRVHIVYPPPQPFVPPAR